MSMIPEEYLAANLPDYEKERFQIVIKVCASIFLFIFVLPYIFATKKVSASDTNCDKEQKHMDTQKDAVLTSPSKKISKNKKKIRNGTKQKPHDVSPQHGKESPQSSTVDKPQETDAVEFSAIISNILTLLCILFIFCILFFSKNNLFPARTILQAPMLTRDECKHIIDIANKAAKVNAENAQKEKDLFMLANPDFNPYSSLDNIRDPDTIKFTKLKVLLKEPSGWHKDRHAAYETVDLNIVTDPFTAEDRTWLAERLNSRLAPLIEKGFGIFRGAIRANDIFVVRYDAANGQANLRMHTDGSHVSWNILLNDEFEGGGTRFHDRYVKDPRIANKKEASKALQDVSDKKKQKKSPDNGKTGEVISKPPLNNNKRSMYVDAKPTVGEGIISNAEILHEGLAITKGTRYILVGFNSIDEKDPLTKETTNLSLWSSWLNPSWAVIRLKQGLEDALITRSRNVGEGGLNHSRYAVSLFRDLYNSMKWMLDRFAPVTLIKVVSSERANEYIAAMDQAMQQRKEEEAKLGIQPTRGAGYPSWYQGQQIELDIFGNYRNKWATREQKEDKFRGDDL